MSQNPTSRVAPEVNPAGGGVVSNEEQAATFPGSGSTASAPLSDKVKEAAESIKRKLGAAGVTYDNADATGNDHRVDMYPQGARSASRSRDRSQQGRQQRAGPVDPEDYIPAGGERQSRSTRQSNLHPHQEHHHSHHHGEAGAGAQGEIAPGTGRAHRG